MHGLRPIYPSTVSDNVNGIIRHKLLKNLEFHVFSGEFETFRLIELITVIGSRSTDVRNVTFSLKQSR